MNIQARYDLEGALPDGLVAASGIGGRLAATANRKGGFSVAQTAPMQGLLTGGRSAGQSGCVQRQATRGRYGV
jgi:hypothetical protein